MKRLTATDALGHLDPDLTIHITADASSESVCEVIYFEIDDKNAPSPMLSELSTQQYVHVHQLRRKHLPKYLPSGSLTSILGAQVCVIYKQQTPNNHI